MAKDAEKLLLVSQKSQLQSDTLGKMQYTDEGNKAPPEQRVEMNISVNMNMREHVPAVRGITPVDGRQQSVDSFESNDPNDSILISQFHSDALDQTEFGNFSIIVTLYVGLGLASQAIQIYAVFFVLPFVELEFCIIDEKENWLAYTTLIGLGIGSLIWGGLAGEIGRRKAMLCSLFISGICSAASTFMPTFDSFMWARFITSIGVGGLFPVATTYLCEVIPNNFRARMLSILCTIGSIGLVFACFAAVTMIPILGQEVVQENKKKFCAWHQYLLVVTTPTLIAIIGMFWLPESPRWLLEVDRETEALTVYQRIFRLNRARPSHSMKEVELPITNAQPCVVPKFPVLHGMMKSIRLFFTGFLRLFRKENIVTTFLLLFAWVLALGLCCNLTALNVMIAKKVVDERISEIKTSEVNVTFEQIVFNQSIENVKYHRVFFTNCTFHNMFLKNVEFKNCSFLDTDFLNVLASLTTFENSLFRSVHFIDSYFDSKMFINCIKINTDEIKQPFTCENEFNFNLFHDAFWDLHLTGLCPIVLAILFLGDFAHVYGRVKIAIFSFTVAIAICIAMGCFYDLENIKWFIGLVQAFIICGLIALTLLTIEQYPTSLRCSALGLFLFSGYIGALLGSPIYLLVSFESGLAAAGMSILILLMSLMVISGLKDPTPLL